MLYMIVRRYPGFEAMSAKIGALTYDVAQSEALKCNMHSLAHYGYRAYYITPILDI